MEIKNIKINNYGTLKQKEINLENNINIIYGKNESGKSTLLNYLKNMEFLKIKMEKKSRIMKNIYLGLVKNSQEK